MKHIILVLTILLMSCGTKRSVTETVTVQKIVERTEYIKDTLYISIPQQSQEVVTRDTISFLENDYAFTTARIDTLGMLHHKLSTKPRDVPIPTETPVIIRDSIVYKDRIVPRPVERKLKTSERIAIKGFPFVLSVLLLCVLWLLKKPLLRHLKK